MKYSPKHINHLEVNTSTKVVHILDTEDYEEIAFDVDTARKLAQYILDVYGTCEEATAHVPRRPPSSVP